MLRTVVFYVFLVLWTVVLANAVLLVALVAPQSGLMHKIGRFWSRGLLKVAGVSLQVSGLEHLQPGQPYIYAANHQSAFDIFALIAALPYPVNFLAKIELFGIPFFGLAIKKMGCLPVDRSNRQAAVQSLEQAAAAVREGNSLIIFPEGTRSPDGTLLPFKKGGFVLAIKSGCPIVPVSLSGSRYIWPKGGGRLQPGPIKVVFGPPIPTSVYTLRDKDRLLAVVQEAIARHYEPDFPAGAAPSHQVNLDGSHHRN